MALKSQLRLLRPYLARARNSARDLALHLKPRGGLPDVVIIGAQKAGTTSLFSALSAHDGIIPARMKEVHFADWNWHRGVGWYERCFPTGPGLRLEATPNYLFFPHAAARLAQTAPKARLIAILRDPVARALSHHRYETQRGSERRPFEQAIADEIAAGDTAWDQAVSDPKNWTHSLQHHAYLRRGLYAAHLDRWGAHFGRDQILVIEDRALYADPKTELEKVLSFAGLPLTQTLSLERVNAGQRPAQTLDPALYAYFAEDTANLIRDWAITPSWSDRCKVGA